MKMKIKIRYTTILLTMIFCAISVVCILMVHHLNLTETLSRMGSGHFGESSSLIKITGDVDSEKIIDDCKAFNIPLALYTDKQNEDGTIRHIFFNDYYVNIPMKDGRFFVKSDFFNDAFIAVIGKNKEKEVYLNASNNKCITIDNKEYEVIGVIGYENSTILDDYVYLNFNSLNDIDSPLIMIDYFNTDKCNEMAEIFVDRVTNSYISAEILSGSVSYSDSIMPKIVSARWFLAIIVCCLICLLLVSIQWINSQKKEITVRMLVGATSRDISRLVIKKYLLIFLIAFFIGYIYCYVFYPAYIINLIYGGLIFSLFDTIFLLWSLYHLLHINVQEALK